MVANRTLVYKQIPVGVPVPGQDLVIEDRPIDLEADAPEGGVVLEILYASFDPYLRGAMRDPKTTKSYFLMQTGQAVSNDTVAKVLKSDAEGLKAGDLVKAHAPIAEYARLDKAQMVRGGQPAVRVLSNPLGLDPGLWLGVLGMPGLTAYSGLLEIGQPKAGETLFVSSAAGAVGQIVGQLGKRLGLTVIGSVGSDEKLAYITEELGFDGGFNYKTETPAAALARLAPKGIDIYWENVGGEHLEAALQAMNVGGRIAVCGLISEYNTPDDKKKGIKGLDKVVTSQLTMRGFLVFNPAFGPAYYARQQKDFQQWLHEGSLKAKLSVTEGIENAAEGFVGMLAGKNFGKAVLKLK